MSEYSFDNTYVYCQYPKMLPRYISFDFECSGEPMMEGNAYTDSSLGFKTQLIFFYNKRRYMID